MERYAVYLNAELLDVAPRRGSQRQKVMEFVRSLADNPFAQGDFSDKDTAQRVRKIKIIGDYAVT